MEPFLQFAKTTLICRGPERRGVRTDRSKRHGRVNCYVIIDDGVM